MPTQWRSIAAIVGRTAAQCLERYEKLLDAATGGAEAEGEEARKLRVGEVDPSPETKPALPDAVDMEEEEKEMLQEARARMANTSGKKAKRKAREKAMEDGRRLSIVQRKRELKAAGIMDASGQTMSRLSRKKMLKLGPDFNSEIHFFHAPVAGFHDVNEELAREKAQSQKPVDFKAATLKAKPSRADDIEEKRRKQDIANEKAKMAADPIKALEKLHEAAKERLSRIRRASHLNLPNAQLSDADIKTLSKMAYDPSLDASIAPGSNATRGLLAPYASSSSSASHPGSSGQKSLATPSVDPLMAEASHQAYMRTLQTPLLVSNSNSDENGSSRPQNVPSYAMTSQLKLGAYKDALSTPNPLATPLLAGAGSSSNSVHSTPKLYGSSSSSNANRDHFGLNTPSLQTPGTFGSSMSTSEMRAAQRNAANKISLSLASLPSPKHTEFSIDMPEIASSPLQYSKPTHSGPLDVSDRERAIRLEQQMRLQMLEAAKSTVLKRISSGACMPRPNKVPSDIQSEPIYDNPEMNGALRLIDLEMLDLIKHDFANFPAPGQPPVPMTPSETYANTSFAGSFSEAELDDARSLLMKEIENIKQSSSSEVSFEEFRESWNQLFFERHGLKSELEREASKSAGAKRNSKFFSKAEISVTTLQHTLARVQQSTQNVVNKIEPLEKRLSVVQGGFAKRYEIITKELDALVAQCVEAHHDLTSFQTQFERESQAQPQRLEEAKESLDAAKRREKALQERYQSLLDKKNGTSNNNLERSSNAMDTTA